jgi:RecB family exonuclease
MTSLRLVCSRSPRRLLAAAADGFLVRRTGTREEPFPTVPYLLALRQGGLRDDLFALAAERGIPGWWDPPLCTFAELPERLGLPAEPPVGDFARLVLLAETTRRYAPALLGDLAREGAFLDALDRLVGELVQEGVTPEALTAALDGIQGRDAFEVKRDGELAAIYAGWHEALFTNGLRDPRAARVDCARAIRADAAKLAKALGGRRELRLLGLHDPRGGWQPLLEALRHSDALDAITIYGADPAVAGALGATLGATLEWLDDRASLADRLFDEPPVKGGTVEIVSAPDPERGLEEIAVRVRDLVDGGVKPSRIAVVSRKARPLVDLAVDALERVGVGASARRRIGFAEIPAVRALSALFAGAAEGWTRYTLAEIADQPYLASDLDARIVNFIGYEQRVEGLDAWVAQHEKLLARGRRRQQGDEEEDERRTPLPALARIETALAGMRAFAEEARPLDTARTLADWLGWLHEALEEDRFGIAKAIAHMVDGRWDIVRRDLAGWRALTGAVKEWQEAVERWQPSGERLTATQFHERLQHLLSADAALWTPAHRGVRVLEALAAAYRDFDHVFVVGLEAGAVPAAPPRSPILDETERAALAVRGLPFETREAWEARERTLFRLLAGAAPSVTLVHARLDDRGRDVAPSAFLDVVRDVAEVTETSIATGRVRTPRFPLWSGEAAAAQARHGAYIERERLTEAPTVWNGHIQDPALLERIGQRLGDAYTWSPTQLESYAKCPWSWFAQRFLRVEQLEDPDVDLDAATRGTILHRALKLFYDGLVAARGGPVFLRAPEVEGLLPRLDAALEQAVREEGDRSWLGHPALQRSQMAEMRELLHGYVTWEAEHNEDTFNNRTKVSKRLRTAVTEHELAFDGLVFERGGVRVKFRGSIDRVEVDHDDRTDETGFVAAVDYKSSRWGAPGSGRAKAWDEKVVLQVPLYAWALGQLKPGTRTARTEYRALKQKESVLVLALATVDRKTRIVADDLEARAKMEQALDAVAEHVRNARDGQYPPRYVETCKCSDFCPGWDICRVPGGPQSIWDF